MPTDAERREVAAKLRDMACRANPSWPALMDLLKCPGRAVAVQYLADLIEPEERTCRNVSDDKRGFICSGCGTHVRGGSCCHSYVDDAGTRWYTTVDKPGLNFCPNCGARVIRDE